jgi:hypothetical protein
VVWRVAVVVVVVVVDNLVAVVVKEPVQAAKAGKTAITIKTNIIYNNPYLNFTQSASLPDGLQILIHKV